MGFKGDSIMDSEYDFIPYLDLVLDCGYVFAPYLELGDPEEQLSEPETEDSESIDSEASEEFFTVEQT